MKERNLQNTTVIIPTVLRMQAIRSKRNYVTYISATTYMRKFTKRTQTQTQTQVQTQDQGIELFFLFPEAHRKRVPPSE